MGFFACLPSLHVPATTWLPDLPTSKGQHMSSSGNVYLQPQLGCSRLMVLTTAALGWLESCRFNDAGLELTFLTLLEQTGKYDNAPSFDLKGLC